MRERTGPASQRHDGAEKPLALATARGRPALDRLQAFSGAIVGQN
jgi:hypothetical protein